MSEDDQEAERAAQRQELASIASALRAYVEYQRDAGTVGFPRQPRARPADEAPPPQPVIESAPAAPAPAPAQPAPDAPAEPPPLPPAPAPEPKTLPQLAAEVATCRRCGLCSKRKRAAFGRGEPGATVMFVGEAPGQEDDEQGKPFVGRAGQLLDRMIAAMKLGDGQAYICNVIKCRPPGNRRPEPEEIAACLPYLHEQIALVRPKIIVALGNVAIGAILQTSDGVDKLRGGWRLYRGQTLVLPTYHPSRLLRQDEQQAELRKKAWEDLQLAMNELARLKA